MIKVIHIPEGPGNLKDFFPEVYFPDVSEYTIQAIDSDNNVIATSSINKADLCCDIRLHFINSCGQIDSINFRHLEKNHSTKSDLWEQSRKVNFSRINSGRLRQNIQSENNLELETSFYQDKDLPFLQDFVNSPMIFIEMNIDGLKDYVPLIISDSTIPQKAKDVFEYQIQIKGYLSNSRINYR